MDFEGDMLFVGDDGFLDNYITLVLSSSIFPFISLCY